MLQLQENAGWSSWKSSVILTFCSEPTLPLLTETPSSLPCCSTEKFPPLLISIKRGSVFWSTREEPCRSLGIQCSRGSFSLLQEIRNLPDFWRDPRLKFRKCACIKDVLNKFFLFVLILNLFYPLQRWDCIWPLSALGLPDVPNYLYATLFKKK